MPKDIHDLATYPACTPDETLLAELGYKQEFKRDFNTLELFGLGFSIIGVLPSIASVLVYSIPYGGAFSMVHGWFVCSFFLIFIGLAMSELGSAAPTAGGVYYWTFRFSSERYRYFLCWIMGYINTITYIAAFTGIEWGCAIQVMAAISIGTDLSFVPSVYHIYGVFVALAVVHCILCCQATRFIARMQLFFVLLNIAICFVVIIGLPVNVPAELKNDTNYVFRHFENMSLWPSGFAFVLGFLAPLWVVGGFDCSVHISEEARNANVAIPWAIMSSTTLACALGWIINIALAFTMGKDLGNIMGNPIGQPLATIILGALGKKGTIALWTFIIIAQFQMGTNIVGTDVKTAKTPLTILVQLTSSSRQNFAFSRDGALPFSKYLYYINPSTKIPSRCVCFGVACSILLGLVALAGPAAAGAIFSMSVVGQYVCNATVITTRWLGGNRFKHGPFNLGFMSLPVSVVAVGFMMLMAVILCFPAEPQVDANTMNYTALVLGGVVLFSTLYYFFPVVGGRYWFEGPAVTIATDRESKVGSDSSVLREGSEVKE